MSFVEFLPIDYDKLIAEKYNSVIVPYDMQYKAQALYFDEGDGTQVWRTSATGTIRVPLFRVIGNTNIANSTALMLVSFLLPALKEQLRAAQKVVILYDPEAKDSEGIRIGLYILTSK